MAKKCRHTHITVKGCDQCLIAELEETIKWYESAIEDGSGYFGSLVKANKELEAENKRMKDLMGQAIMAEEFHYLKRKSRVHVRLGGVIANMRKALQSPREGGSDG